ncbi:MAG: hypothetical protein H0T42_30620 [Deltaproteobacteria bacterium]|nr:hypothetical protein [Deltaproteobacteria bacterium]
MIPYEELVIALTSWRAKQGLPVAGGIAPPPGSGPTQQRSGPPAAPPGAMKTGSTGPQQAFLGNVSPPPPLADAEDSLDVDESALLEEANYDAHADDFSATEGQQADDGESTSIGAPPAVRTSEHTLDDGGNTPSGSGSNRNRNEDW